MNCLKCGLQTLPEQKFCRACGSNLQMITQPLAELATVPDLQRTPATNSKNEIQRAKGLTPWGVIIMFIGVAIGVMGKMLIHEDIVTVVGVLVSLVGMFLTVYPYLSPSPRRKFDSDPSLQPEVPTSSQPAKYLSPEGNIEYVPSITERTTDLLKSSLATTPKQEEGDVRPGK